jgi:hypothetical protein
MTGAAIARKFGVATKTVTHDWVGAGCPRNADKSFDYEKVLAWRKAKLNEAANDPAVKAAGAKAALQAKRLMLQCEQLEVVLLRDKGRLHDKAACCQSLGEVVIQVSSRDGTRAQRFKAAFPEAAQSMIDWLKADHQETTRIMKALRVS